MRIVLLAAENLPCVVATSGFLEKHRSEVAAVCLLPSVPAALSPGKSRSWRFFLRLPAEVLFYKFLETPLHNAVRRLLGRPSVASVAAARGIPLLRLEDPNSPRALELLRGLSPDAIFNLSPSILKAPVLGLPRAGCFNFHGGLLPRYRGVANYFWFLIDGSPVAGASVHRMLPEIDAGDVVAEASFPVSPEDTVHSINFKTSALGPALLGETLRRLRDGDLRSKPQDASEARTRGFPSREDVRRLRRSGRRLFSWKDLWATLRY